MKSQISFEIDPERRRGLKILAAQLDLPVKALLETAVDMILKNEADHMTTDRVALDATSRRQWEKYPKLQAEFRDFESYAAWRRAVENKQCPGQIKKGPVISVTRP